MPAFAAFDVLIATMPDCRARSPIAPTFQRVGIADVPGVICTVAAVDGQDVAADTSDFPVKVFPPASCATFASAVSISL